MRVSEWIDRTTLALHAAGVEAAKTQSRVLAQHVLGVDRNFLFAHPEVDFPELAGEALVARLLSGEPLAYIVGRREFYGREFSVNPAVLIPRPETELLVDWISELEVQSVWDIGTGSGCIGVSVKLERPNLHVWASDVSERALEVAALNAQTMHADVNFALGDLFDAFPELQVDLVVSNPPYVERDSPHLDPASTAEPEIALFADEGGLAIYRRLADEGCARTRRLLVEIGFDQGESVPRLLSEFGWSGIEVRTDLSGLPRAVLAHYAV